MSVRTVLGDIDEAQLGVTLMHEHLALDMYRTSRRRDQLLAGVDVIAEEIGQFRDAGGGAIVELTTPDLGRRPRDLVELSERTGLHIVMGAGRYREPYYERAIWTTSTPELADDFTREAEVGVDGVRPGILGELGADGYEVSPAEERVHRAIARTHRQTGLPISTHGLQSPVGLQQIAILEEEGVNLEQVAIGHCDSFPSMDYHLSILKAGAYVQFDLIRGAAEVETERQVRAVCDLVEKGYLQRILLSQDIYANRLLTAYGGPGYAYICREFVPRLRAAGLDKDEIDTILIANPARLLSISA